MPKIAPEIQKFRNIAKEGDRWPQVSRRRNVQKFQGADRQNGHDDLSKRVWFKLIKKEAWSWNQFEAKKFLEGLQWPGAQLKSDNRKIE